MKKMHSLSKTDFAVFCLLAVCSGLIIGIGGISSLLARFYFGDWGRLIGAILFSLGIFAIVAYELRLFTGMVADIPKMHLDKIWTLPVCFLGNILGVAVVALLAYFSPVKSAILPIAQEIIAAKFVSEQWPIYALTSSIFCGGLITLSVWSVKFAPKKGLSPTVGVMLPIIVFAFCGFDHSVANMLYFYYFGEFSWRVIGYILLSVVGNIFGGIVLPLISLYREKSQTSK